MHLFNELHKFLHASCRLVHYTTSAIANLFVSRKISEAFDHYAPDLVVSVHPLMQHVPLRVLRLRVMCAPSTLFCPLGAIAHGRGLDMTQLGNMSSIYGISD